VTWTDDEIAAIEAPRTVHWWGADHVVKPRVLRKVFGDGSILKAFVPLATRPNYYLVRVGPEWASTDEREDDDVDDVMEAIEAQFGTTDSCDDCPEDCPGFGEGHNVDGGSGWPAFDDSCGWMFEDIELRALCADVLTQTEPPK